MTGRASMTGAAAAADAVAGSGSNISIGGGAIAGRLGLATLPGAFAFAAKPGRLGLLGGATAVVVAGAWITGTGGEDAAACVIVTVGSAGFAATGAATAGAEGAATGARARDGGDGGATRAPVDDGGAGVRTRGGGSAGSTPRPDVGERGIDRATAASSPVDDGRAAGIPGEDSAASGRARRFTTVGRMRSSITSGDFCRSRWRLRRSTISGSTALM